jgi:hypothetical protein
VTYWLLLAPAPPWQPLAEQEFAPRETVVSARTLNRTATPRAKINRFLLADFMIIRLAPAMTVV